LFLRLFFFAFSFLFSLSLFPLLWGGGLGFLLFFLPRRLFAFLLRNPDVRADFPSVLRSGTKLFSRWPFSPVALFLIRGLCDFLSVRRHPLLILFSLPFSHSITHAIRLRSPPPPSCAPRRGKLLPLLVRPIRTYPRRCRAFLWC